VNNTNNYLIILRNWTISTNQSINQSLFYSYPKSWPESWST